MADTPQAAPQAPQTPEVQKRSRKFSTDDIEEKFSNLPPGTTVTLHGNFDDPKQHAGWDTAHPTTLTNGEYTAEIPDLIVGKKYEYKFCATLPDGTKIWLPKGENAKVEIIAPTMVDSAASTTDAASHAPLTAAATPRRRQRYFITKTRVLIAGAVLAALGAAGRAYFNQPSDDTSAEISALTTNREKTPKQITVKIKVQLADGELKATINPPFQILLGEQTDIGDGFFQRTATIIVPGSGVYEIPGGIKGDSLVREGDYTAQLMQ